MSNKYYQLFNIQNVMDSCDLAKDSYDGQGDENVFKVTDKYGKTEYHIVSIEHLETSNTFLVEINGVPFGTHSNKGEVYDTINNAIGIGE